MDNNKEGEQNEKKKKKGWIWYDFKDKSIWQVYLSMKQGSLCCCFVTLRCPKLHRITPHFWYL